MVSRLHSVNILQNPEFWSCCQRPIHIFFSLKVEGVCFGGRFRRGSGVFPGVGRPSRELGGGDERGAWNCQQNMQPQPSINKSCYDTGEGDGDWRLPQSGVSLGSLLHLFHLVALGTLKAKRPGICSRAGTCKEERPLQEPKPQPFLPPPKCDLVSCPPPDPSKRYSLGNTRSRRNFLFPSEPRNTPTAAWGWLVTFSAPRLTSSFLTPLPPETQTGTGSELGWWTAASALPLA